MQLEKTDAFAVLKYLDRMCVSFQSALMLHNSGYPICPRRMKQQSVNVIGYMQQVLGCCGMHAITVTLSNLCWCTVSYVLVSKVSVENQSHCRFMQTSNRTSSILPANKAIRHKHLPEHHLNDFTIT